MSGLCDPLTLRKLGTLPSSASRCWMRFSDTLSSSRQTSRLVFAGTSLMRLSCTSSNRRSANAVMDSGITARKFVDTSHSTNELSL